MLRVVDSLRDFARWTSTSFAELRDGGSRPPPDSAIEGDLIYRLRQWPDLPPSLRTARVLRLLSVMSSRRVNRHWMIRQSGKPAEVDALLALLVAGDWVEVIDPQRFRGVQQND